MMVGEIYNPRAAGEEVTSGRDVLLYANGTGPWTVAVKVYTWVHEKTTQSNREEDKRTRIELLLFTYGGMTSQVGLFGFGFRAKKVKTKGVLQMRCGLVLSISPFSFSTWHFHLLTQEHYEYFHLPIGPSVPPPSVDQCSCNTC